MDNKLVVILGLTPQGLSLLRTLSQTYAIIHAFYINKKQVGVYSKYGHRKYVKDVQQLKLEIKSLIEKYKCKPLCYITSGELLAVILRDYKELYEECDVISSTYEIIEKLAHKDLMYKYAIQKGLKTAKFCTLDKYSNGLLSYPLFLKRNYEIPLFFKTATIASQDEFNTYFNRIKREERKDIIVQEQINIPSSFLLEISSQSFFSKGIPKGYLICNQKRRLKKGITSYIEEITDKELVQRIKEECSKFMQNLEYTGFAEFEFMYNTKTKELFFIEINTRTCGLQSAMSHKFGNLAEVILNPYNAPDLVAKTNHLKWMNIIRDVRVRLEKKDFSSLADFYHSKYDIWNIHDVKPFFKQLLK